MGGPELRAWAAAPRAMQRLYFGPPCCGDGVGSAADGPPSLLQLARARGVASIEAPPLEVAVFVVGDAGSGKSSFINCYAEELLLPQPGGAEAGRQSARGRASPLRWVRGTGAPGGLPRLLLAAAARYPGALGTDLTACLAGSAVSARLHTVDLVEVSADAWADPTVAEALAWIASRAGVVLCLADSQRQPALSAELLAFLRRVASSDAQPCLQFVLSKMDLVTRESDRIRLTGKVSRLINDTLGKVYEVLPMGRKGCKEVLLQALAAAPTVVRVGGRTFEVPRALDDDQDGAPDAGTRRAMEAAERCAAERGAAALARLAEDARVAGAAVQARLAMLPAPGAAASAGGPRRTLFAVAAALLLVGAAAPVVLEEDLDAELVPMMRVVVFALAAVVLLLAVACSSAEKAPAPAARMKDKASAAAASGAAAGELADVVAAVAAGPQAVAALCVRLGDELHFCRLVMRQQALWASSCGGQCL